MGSQQGSQEQVPKISQAMFPSKVAAAMLRSSQEQFPKQGSE